MEKRETCKRKLHRVGHLALAGIYAAIGLGWIDKTAAAWCAALIYWAMSI